MTSPEQAPLSEAAAQRDTIIFIPAWNEADNLPAVFQDIAEHVPVLAQETGPVFFGGVYQRLTRRVEIIGHRSAVFLRPAG